MQSHSTGIRNLNLNSYKDLQLSYPSLKEQERIINKLDEATEGITTARENVGKSIANAREFFQSKLQSLLGTSINNGLLTSLGEQTDISTGFPFKSEGYTESIESIRLLRGDNIIQGQLRWEDVKKWPIAEVAEYSDYALRADDVVLAMDRTWVKAGIKYAALSSNDVPCLLVQRTARMRARKTLSPMFLRWLIGSERFTEYVLSVQTGSGVPHISGPQIKAFTFQLPSMKDQCSIANHLDQISAETDRLKEVYSQKLAALDELKQSLLHKAFVGRLTGQPSRAVVTHLPVTLTTMSTTDLHVGVLAVAYANHETLHRASDFGHVKAEKIAHMVEAYVGVDLGRTPLRDAAGPNDFPHLKKVEHRADRAGYLTFVRQESGGYRVTKKAGFDSLVTKTRTAFGDRNQDLDRLLNLMTPMTTKQAEIFATVYAAWNNLLMDGEPINDERIVCAAREDWHSDKLNIPRDKFFTAIEWIRTKGLCPEGQGKRVEAKKH